MIDLVFALFNSLLALALCWYGFKKYGLPFIQREYQQSVLDKQLIEQSLRSAHHTIEELEKLHVLRQQELDAMRSKIFLWRQRVQELEQERQEILVENRAALRLKHSVQAQHYHEEQLFERLKPQVIERLSQSVSRSMENPDNQLLYMDKALDAFERADV